MVRAVFFAVVQRLAQVQVRARMSQRHAVFCVFSAGAPLQPQPRTEALGRQRARLPRAATRLYVGSNVVVWTRLVPYAVLCARAPWSPGNDGGGQITEGLTCAGQ